MNDFQVTVAKVINGPHLPPPSTSKFSLDELRQVRWDHLSSQDQGVLLKQARAVIAFFNTKGLKHE